MEEETQVLSIEELQKARERAKREREAAQRRQEEAEKKAKQKEIEARIAKMKEQEEAATRAAAAVKDRRVKEALRREKEQEKAREEERAKWKKTDYKPGLLKPGSVTQYAKRYKRKESPADEQKKRRQRVRREQIDKLYKEKQAKSYAAQASARWRAKKRAERLAALPQMTDEMAELLKNNSHEYRSLDQAMVDLCMDAKHAAKILKQYGAERQANGLYLRGQMERALLVYRNENPRVPQHAIGKDFFTYDQAAAYVGVHHDSIKKKARWEAWPKIYSFVESAGQICVLLRARDVENYKARYEEWLAQGESDHTHCLKARQARRSHPRKAKHR